MNNVEYVRLSLELHLFFDRIMKEHSFFLEAAFTEKDSDLKKEALILGKRVLMGVIVFLMPSIVNLAVNTLDNNPNADYKVCVDCLTKPSSCPVKNK